MRGMRYARDDNLCAKGQDIKMGQMKPAMRLKITAAYDNIMDTALEILTKEQDVLEAYWKLELTGIEILKYVAKQIKPDMTHHILEDWNNRVERLKNISLEFFGKESIQTKMWSEKKLTDLELIIEMLKKWRSVV